MYRDYKIVCVVPAGRRRYLRVLLPYLLEDPRVDAIHLWENTNDPADQAFIRMAAEQLPKVTRVAPPQIPPDGIYSIYQFFRTTVDPDTLYIRFDDDVVFVEEDFFRPFLDFRLDHPEPLLTFPFVVNNSVCTYLLELLGNSPLDELPISPWCMDPVGWGRYEVAEALHRVLLLCVQDGFLDRFRIPNRTLSMCRFSINCFAWFGRRFASFDGEVAVQEELDLSVDLPMKLDTHNAIFGERLVSHFAFAPQRERLDRLGLLSRYTEVMVGRCGPRGGLSEALWSLGGEETPGDEGSSKESRIRHEPMDETRCEFGVDGWRIA